MLALAPSNTATTKPKRTTPNLLPCSIHHNGPVPTSGRYWSPTNADFNGVKTKTSYFRGRKLAGRTLKLPSGYTGLVLQKTPNILPVKPKVPTADELRAMEEELSDDGVGGGLGGREEDVEVKTLETQAEFDELVVWGHELVPEEDDVYVRGVEEWVGFAEAMHCDDRPVGQAETNGAT